jgi:hypothetical protein
MITAIAQQPLKIVLMRYDIDGDGQADELTFTLKKNEKDETEYSCSAILTKGGKHTVSEEVLKRDYGLKRNDNLGRVYIKAGVAINGRFDGTAYLNEFKPNIVNNAYKNLENEAFVNAVTFFKFNAQIKELYEASKDENLVGRKANVDKDEFKDEIFKNSGDYNVSFGEPCISTCRW